MDAFMEHYMTESEDTALSELFSKYLLFSNRIYNYNLYLTRTNYSNIFSDLWRVQNPKKEPDVTGNEVQRKVDNK